MYKTIDVSTKYNNMDLMGVSPPGGEGGRSWSRVLSSGALLYQHAFMLARISAE
jgi:hypothetical protein